MSFLFLFFYSRRGLHLCCVWGCVQRVFFFFFFHSNFLQRSGRVYKYWSAALCGIQQQGTCVSRKILEKEESDRKTRRPIAGIWNGTRGHFDESTAQQTKKTKVPFDFGSRRLSLAEQRHSLYQHPTPSTCSILFGCCAGRCFSHPSSGGRPYMMEECFPFSLCAQTARNVGKKAPLFTLGNRHTHRERPKEKGASFK